jgi:hypothetical protein
VVSLRSSPDRSYVYDLLYLWESEHAEIEMKGCRSSNCFNSSWHFKSLCVLCKISDLKAKACLSKNLYF